MKIISYILMTILMQSSYNSVAQKSESYHFTIKEKAIVDSISGFYLHSELEFTYHRIFLPDSSFKEVGLFIREDNSQTACHFKIKKGNWYIKNKNKWELFYSVNKQISPRVQIAGRWYKFEATKTGEINGNNSIIYKPKLINGQSGEEIYYWFNPQKGIIMLKSDDVELIREDLIGK